MTEGSWAMELGELVLAGKAPESRALTEKVLSSGVLPEEVLDKGLVPAMDEAGRRFEDQRFFLPELMFAARAMKGALELLKPLLAERKVPPQGKVVIGTVAGDLHDIGKNIVAAMLEGGGFAVKDMGANVTPEAFAEAARSEEADIVALSALLTTTIPVMREVVVELGRSGVRDQVKVLVGGAPLTQLFAREIGADAYAESAAQAVQVAHSLMEGGEVWVDEVDGTPGKVESAPAPVRPSVRSAAPAPTMEDGTDRLTSRELVKRTLDFRAPPRLPRQMWLLPWAESRYPEEVKRIQTGYPQDITTIPFLCSEPVPGGGNAHSVGTFVDGWGCEFENLQDGIIGQVKNPQLRDWSEAGSIRFPRERLDVDLDAVADFCRETEKYVLAGTCPRPFERIQFLRGPEETYLDLNRPPAEMLDFIQELHAFYLEELRIWVQTDVDALTFMDDWGSQKALLVAPELWRELFKPLYADYIALAHEHGKHCFMHSDGHITEIIPDLIEIGLDALNSQVFCMGVEELGSRFAGELTFWGEIDRQQLLPRASTAEIAEAARGMRNAFHRDGGFIAQCEFGPGARPENIHAFFEALTG